MSAGAGTGQIVIDDELTLTMLGQLSRRYGVTYGKVVELLVMEEVVREALREHASSVQISEGWMEKIRERLEG